MSKPLRDVFAHEPPPQNLAVETIDTREKWQRFRELLGDEIKRAVDSLAPRGMTVAYDTEAMQKLVELAPPGADELFAISRLADLAADESQAAVIVDTSWAEGSGTPAGWLWTVPASIPPRAS